MPRLFCMRLNNCSAWLWLKLNTKIALHTTHRPPHRNFSEDSWLSRKLSFGLYINLNLRNKPPSPTKTENLVSNLSKLNTFDLSHQFMNNQGYSE